MPIGWDEVMVVPVPVLVQVAVASLIVALQLRTQAPLARMQTVLLWVPPPLLGAVVRVTVRFCGTQLEADACTCMFASVAFAVLTPRGAPKKLVLVAVTPVTSHQ